MGESTYLAAPNLRVTAADGAEYAYRDVGPRDARAIAMIQHLRGNLDKPGIRRLSMRWPSIAASSRSTIRASAAAAVGWRTRSSSWRKTSSPS